MVITELRRRRGRLYLVVLDGQPADAVDMALLEESPYRVGSELDEEEWTALLEQSRERRAKDKALYLLSLRDHSRGELEKKLGREAGKDTAAAVAQRMEELGFVDDEAYAGRLARDLAGRKLYSRRRVLQELSARGIARELAEQAVTDANIDDAAQALALLRKKYYNRLGTEEDRRKTVAALARYGFGYEAIRAAFRELELPEE